MKPCRSQRRRIVLHASTSLSRAEQQDLKHHLSQCERCREYHSELLALVRLHENAEAALPQAELSTAVYRAVAARIRRKPVSAFWSLPRTIVVGSIAAAGLCLVLFPRPDSTTIPQTTRSSTRFTATLNKAEPDTSLAAYRQALALSPQKLEELLARQISVHAGDGSEGVVRALAIGARE